MIQWHNLMTLKIARTILFFSWCKINVQSLCRYPLHVMPPSCYEWWGRVNSKNPVCSVTSGPMQSIRLFLISGWLRFQSLFKWAPTKPEAATSVFSLPVFLPLSLSSSTLSLNIEKELSLPTPLVKQRGSRRGERDGGGCPPLPHAAWWGKTGKRRVRAPSAKLWKANVWQSNYTPHCSGSD